MATILKSKIAREVEAKLDLDSHSRGRNIIIEIEPNGIMSFRFKGTQRKYQSTIQALMQRVVQSSVESDRRGK